MGRNISTRLFYDSAMHFDYFALSAGSTINVDIDLDTFIDCKGLIQVIQAGAADVTCSVFYGFGGGDPTATGPVPCKLGTAGSIITATAGTDVAVFSTNSDLITMASGSGVVMTYFYFNDPEKKNPRWQRLQFSCTSAATIRVFIDG